MAFNSLKLPSFALTLILSAAGLAAVAQRAPDPVTSDPPRNAAHPMRNEAVWILSHGVAMNGVMFQAAGLEPHPTVLLVHGLPGNEQNLDLAQALRRFGYNVLTFHFRGSWGSPGNFSLAGGVEDTEAALKFLSDPAQAAQFHVDAKRLILMGHSYGGFTAARVAAAHPEIAGLVLIAPWDPGETVPQFNVPPKDLPAVAHQVFDDVEGRLGGVRDVDLAKELAAPGFDWHLASHAAAFKQLPLLIVTASEDSKDDQAAALMAALNTAGAAKVTSLRMSTDHPFTDHRIALAETVIHWLREKLGAT